jgi:ribonuclease BN (tRNA processing enzyme)
MPSRSLSRRAFLAATGGIVAAPVVHAHRPNPGSALATSVVVGPTPARPSQPAAGARTRLVLLGTAGGPTPKLQRAAPAQAIVCGDRVYLVDCGDGVARQMRLARLPYEQLRAVFITHHHSDHNAGYGALLLVAWASGLPMPVDLHGPPPLEKMTRLILEANEFDIRTRMDDEGHPPLAPLLRVHEVALVSGLRARPVEIFRDDRVKVTAVLNNHPPIQQSLALRFDAGDRSIVISGDTTYAESVRDLARGADVLVHEALYAPYWQRPEAPLPKAIVRHILASHTDAVDVGRLAAEAEVKTLVLTHFVPSDPPGAVTDEQWLEAASRHFKGRVVLGKDLMEI